MIRSESLKMITFKHILGLEANVDSCTCCVQLKFLYYYDYVLSEVLHRR